MKIYITGKVTGTPINECKAKFGTVQKELVQRGHEPINPLEVVNDWHTPWTTAMRKCLTELMTADAIFALSCSHDSRGAQIELKLAKELNIPVYVSFVEIPQS